MTASSSTSASDLLAEEAIADFARICRLFGTATTDLDGGNGEAKATFAFTEDDFCRLLSTIGLLDGDDKTSCSSGREAFKEICAMAGMGPKCNDDANLKLDAQALRRLYCTPTYAACVNKNKTSEDLMGAVTRVFAKACREEDLEEEETETAASTLVSDDLDPDLDCSRRSSLTERDSDHDPLDCSNRSTLSERSLTRSGSIEMLRDLGGLGRIASESALEFDCDSESESEDGDDDDQQDEDEEKKEDGSIQVVMVQPSPSSKAKTVASKAHRRNSLSSVDVQIAADELVQQHGTDSLTLENVAASLLRLPSNPNEFLPPNNPLGLNTALFNPFHTTGSEFTNSVENAALNHDALNHHLTDSIAKGSYGKPTQTIELVGNFMAAYQCFTSNFTSYLRDCTTLVGKTDPSHAEILEENLEEEQGIYDEATIQEIREIGLDPEPLDGMPHVQLYKECMENLLAVEGCAMRLSAEEMEYVARPLVEAFEAACGAIGGSNIGSDENDEGGRDSRNDLGGAGGAAPTAATSIAAMYFGSELIVSTLYTKLSQFLRSGGCDDMLSRQDLAFFILHIDMDEDHADKMRDIVVAHASDEMSRRAMAGAVERILNARVEFYDRFLETYFVSTGHGGEDAGALYDKQSNNWVRKEATCLSDFTGRPVIFDMCAPHANGATVLDVGCGEGYGARRLVRLGASRVVGVDVSEGMVERARRNASSTKEVYVVGDATSELVETLYSRPAELGIVPGMLTRDGFFDLAVAVFLFNYTNITQMRATFVQVFQLLKPGGRFIFSVPHPFMLNAHNECNSTDDGENGPPSSSFSFARGEDTTITPSSYFSLRDRKFAGTIRCLDGSGLNVKMCFKTISDYIEATKRGGFEMVQMHECRVLPEHVSAHPAFFESVKDSPLHVVFEVRKPSINLSVPRKISWTAMEKASPDAVLRMELPADACEELKRLAIELSERGATADTYEPTDGDVERIPAVVAFAGELRERLVRDVGAAHVKGLDMEAFNQGADSDPLGEKAVQRAKLAYYIICSLVGRVDGSARGALFDVKDRNLDTTSDNVLFSVSNDEAPWHTDGASLDRKYDIASLLCISPAAEGGALRISNAARAFDRLKETLPKFLLYELLRPIPRDVLENGKGKGIEGGIKKFARAADLLSLRTRHNAYPIFVDDAENGRLQIRYMRYWIETGHEKAHLNVSPFLKLAMDALDGALDCEEVFHQRLEAGEMVFCNNLQFAHARESFVDQVGGRTPPRHMVRAWIQPNELDGEHMK